MTDLENKGVSEDSEESLLTESAYGYRALSSAIEDLEERQSKLYPSSDNEEELVNKLVPMITEVAEFLTNSSIPKSSTIKGDVTQLVHNITELQKPGSGANIQRVRLPNSNGACLAFYIGNMGGGVSSTRPDTVGVLLEADESQGEMKERFMYVKPDRSTH